MLVTFWLPSHGCDTSNCRLGGARRVPLRHFFKSYRSVDLHSNEVVVSIEIPLTEQSDHIEAFKVSRRKDDDLAVVCACFGLKLASTADGHKAIASACLSFGGVAATTMLAHETAAFLENKPLTRETLDGALAVLAHEIKIQYSAPGGLPEYRRSLVSRFVLRLHLSAWCPCGRSGIESNLTSRSHLTTDSSRDRFACSLFFKYFLGLLGSVDPALVHDSERSVLTGLTHGVSSSTQTFEQPLVPHIAKTDRVGEPVRHLSALQQVCLCLVLVSVWTCWTLC